MSRISPSLLNLANIADAPSATAGTVTITQLTAPAGGTGATAGGYDTAVNRDLMIDSANAAKTDLALLQANIAALNTEAAGLRTALTQMNLAAERAGIFLDA
jgi:hypothetical protein